MIKQSKLSKICWAIVYLLPIILSVILFWQSLPFTDWEDPSFYGLYEVFSDCGLPSFSIEFFHSSPLVNFFSQQFYASVADWYLGYLVFVSLFRIVWKVLVYLPDVIGKLIDRWSL